MESRIEDRQDGKQAIRFTQAHGRARVMAAVALVMTFGMASTGAYASGGDDVLAMPLDSATEQAFEMQRSGAHAGQQLTMSGDQASAAYARYLKSFDTAIPTFFGSSLKSDVGSGSGSQGGN